MCRGKRRAVCLELCEWSGRIPEACLLPLIGIEARAVAKPPPLSPPVVADKHRRNVSDAKLMRDHHYFTMARIERCDGDLTLAVGTGNLPGGTISFFWNPWLSMSPRLAS